MKELTYRIDGKAFVSSHTFESAIDRLAEYYSNNIKPPKKEWGTLWPPVLIHLGGRRLTDNYFTKKNYHTVIDPHILLSATFNAGLMKNPYYRIMLCREELLKIITPGLRIPHQEDRRSANQIDILFKKTPPQDRITLFGVTDSEADEAAKLLDQIHEKERDKEDASKLRKRLKPKLDLMSQKSREGIKQLVNKIRSGRIKIKAEKPKRLPKRPR